jgi:hypothetical protein
MRDERELRGRCQSLFCRASSEAPQHRLVVLTMSGPFFYLPSPRIQTQDAAGKERIDRTLSTDTPKRGPASPLLPETPSPSFFVAFH